MPIKSRLDSLICEGSMQWRDLCENETYRERFPDKHFDLETVFEAKVRPLSVVLEKSFIGFFHPEGIEEEEGFHFLHGSMSFDNIWDEISKYAQETPRRGISCVYIGTSKGPNQKVPVLSSATLNLADFASVAGDKQECIEIFVLLEVSIGSFKGCLSLCLVLNLVELRNAHEASGTFLKFIMSALVSPNPGKALLTDRNKSEEGKEDTSVQKSFSYEALVYANHAGGSFCSNTSGSSSDEDLVHYIHHISDTKHKYPEDKTAANQSTEQSSKRSLLSWRKRKLSFKYPKTKGEPLLKKHYGEDCADDIEFDRRQLCSSDKSSSRGHKSKETSPISVSEFGDESFVVGSWEQKEIISCDGQMN
ncbi:hypothetical protein P3S68_026795 [Capsicum galapagoense]